MRSPFFRIICFLFLPGLWCVSPPLPVFAENKPDSLSLLRAYLERGYLSADSEARGRKAYENLKKLSNQELLSLAREKELKPARGLLFFYMGKIFFSREKFKEADRFFKKSLGYLTDSSVEMTALKYLQVLKSRKTVRRYKIGAVLPLSGPSAKIGRRVLLGLQMGLGFYLPEKTPFELVILDSQGQPGKAKKALEELVIHHHVIAVAGGVLSVTAQALASEATRFGLPVVLFSHKSYMAHNRPYVFQNALTSDQISHQLVHFLMTHHQVKRFALLYPNDSYGVDYANTFWQAVEKNGGQIQGVQVYKPSQTDFNGPLSRLTGTYYIKDREEEFRDRIKKKYADLPSLLPSRLDFQSVLPPLVDFEALFIPDSLKTFHLIAPHLTYHDIKDIYLVGTSLWNQKPAVKKFLSSPFPIFFADTALSQPSFQKSAFYRQFAGVFNQPPGLFEFQAYEAGLVFRQIIAGGVKTRRDLKNHLSRIKEFPGPLGPVSLSKEGEFQHPLRVFQIQEGQIRSVTKPSVQSKKPL